MSEVALVPLGQVVSLQAGVGFPLDLQGRSEGAYPLAKVGDISRVGRSGLSILAATDHYVDHADLKRLGTKPIPAGSVLFAKIGEAIRQNHRVIAGCPLMIDNNAMAAIPTQLIESRFLYHFLRTVDFYGLASATTVPALRKSVLDKVAVPLPPLAEQRRLVTLLDQAEALQANRGAALTQLDALTQSMFLEMFGDPTTNPKKWPNHRLGEVARFFGGSTLPAGTEFVGQPGGHFLLKVSDMNLDGNEVYLKTCQRWSSAPGADACTCPAGSIVIPKRGGAIATNKKRITVRSAVLDPNLMAVLPRPECLNLSFLYLWFCHLDLASITSGSSVPQLNKRDLDPLMIAVPPIAFQREFSRRRAMIDTHAVPHRASLASLDALFSCIQHRAFRGEL